MTDPTTMPLDEVTIEVTSRCANNCLFCSSSPRQAVPIDLPRKTIVQVAAVAKAAGARRINLSGGEPLLHPQIADVVADIEATGLEVAIYTSGAGPTGPVRLWSALGKGKIVFNVPTLDSACGDILFGRRGALREMEESLGEALFRDRTDGTYRVETHTVVTHQGVPTLHQTIRLLAIAGVKRIRLLRLVVQGEAAGHAADLVLTHNDQTIVRNIVASSQKAVPVLARILELATTAPIVAGVPLDDPSKARPCPAGRGKLVVTAAGRVLPCEAIKDLPEFVLGDVTDFEAIVAHRGPLTPRGKNWIDHPFLDPCPAQRYRRSLLEAIDNANEVPR